MEIAQNHVTVANKKWPANACKDTKKLLKIGVSCAQAQTREESNAITKAVVSLAQGTC